MSIIINNNNNNDGCGCRNSSAESVGNNNPACHGYSYAFDPFESVKGYDRKTMISLARFMGWSGWHYFHFGKPFLGALHLFLSLIGLAGAVAVLYILLFAEEPELLLRIALALIPAFLISVFAGIVCSLYWSVHSDDEFRAAYPQKNNNEKK